MADRRLTMKWWWCALVAAVLLAPATVPAPVHAADPYPPYISPTADWLTAVNYYRAMSGLKPVTENPTFSAGAYKHSCYMLYNGISHGEVAGNPGYTVEGNLAGSNGNVAVSSVYGTSNRSHVELWMTGPFHAIGVLRANLATVGYGKCDLTNTPTWHSGATLDVLRGLNSTPRPATPTLFPGNGTTTSLDRFVVESPNPLTYCGWTGSAGLPVIAMMPEAVSKATGWMSGPSGPVEVCVLSAANTSGAAASILGGDNAVVVIPRVILDPGTYQVGVGTSARMVNWSFTVDPAAKTGVMPAPTPPPPPAPAPTAVPSGGPTWLQTIAPVRVVDTRVNLGSAPFAATRTNEIQITGRLGIPAGVTAVVANVTVVSPSAAGYLTLWNCSSSRPDVSTLNFQAGEVVPNSATLPLDASGRLCGFGSADLQLVIDITGYYTASSSDKYTALTPARLMDTRVPIGPSTSLAAGQTVELRVAGFGGVPSGAEGVALNVASTNVLAGGYVTVFPCTADRPTSSNLNPAVGVTRANLVLSALSASGSVCIFTLMPTDLVVDVVGYLAPTSASKFTPVAPFRFTDTRDRFRIEMNADSGGDRVPALSVLTVQMAGQRGIPAGAQAISANLTVVDGDGSGYLSAWPCGSTPTTSNLNYDRSIAVANAAILPLSSTGAVCLLAFTGAHLIIDVNGWWS